MKYYKMMYNGNLAEDRNYASCLKADLNGISSYAIYEGKKIIDYAWNKIIFYCNLENCILTNWLDNVYGWELFSEEVINKLQPLLGDSVQFLPLTVVDEVGMRLNKNYSVMNVLNVLPFEAMNQNNSEFSCDEMEDGEILYNIVKPSFYADALSGHNIFRMENNMFSLYVSETVRNVIRKMKWSEFGFLEVDVI